MILPPKYTNGVSVPQNFLDRHSIEPGGTKLVEDSRIYEELVKTFDVGFSGIVNDRISLFCLRSHDVLYFTLH